MNVEGQLRQSTQKIKSTSPNERPSIRPLCLPQSLPALQKHQGFFSGTFADRNRKTWERVWEQSWGGQGHCDLSPSLKVVVVTGLGTFRWGGQKDRVG